MAQAEQNMQVLQPQSWNQLTITSGTLFLRVRGWRQSLTLLTERAAKAPAQAVETGLYRVEAVLCSL